MASVLKVDTLTGVTTAGSISVTGEGNSTTTNLQQGLAKQWVYFSMASTTPVDSLNTSSLTDSATGKFRPVVTNPFGSVNYAPNFNTNGYAGDSFNAGVVCAVKMNWELTATTSTYETVAYTSSGYIDATYNYVSAHGDLA